MAFIGVSMTCASPRRGLARQTAVAFWSIEAAGGGTIRSMQEVGQAQRERFGQRVYAVRKHRRGLTLDDVTAAGGPSRGTMVNIEKARWDKQPPRFVFDKLEKALGLRTGTAILSLLNDTDLVLEDDKPEPTYTEQEVTRLRKFVAALERVGVTKRLGWEDVAVHKTSEGEGFVIPQEVIDQITEQLNSHPGSDSRD